MDHLIPFNPNSTMFLWWQAWRDHVRNAKKFPELANGYCQAAMIAQGEYEMQRALQFVARYY